jgi:hypothetical protein
MPATAAFIDALREAFGKDCIDAQIRRGMKGESTFFAQENEQQVGTRNTDFASVVYWDDQGIARSRSPDWMVEARRMAAQVGAAIAHASPGNAMDEHREARELREFLQRHRADVCNANQGKDGVK